MKIQITFLILATLLISSCTSFNTKIEYLGENAECDDLFHTLQVAYVNTSKSKLIEVTIREQDEDGTIWTYTIELNPGDVERDCIENTDKVSIVGEREIKCNE